MKRHCERIAPSVAIVEVEMAEKTPVSVLHELCIQQGHGAPCYEAIAADEDETIKTFACIVSAFDMVAKGSGRSKREAKHEASANLINLLKKLDQFKDLLKEKTPQTPRPTTDTDAVGQLLDICVQREWPLAHFEVIQASGQPHAPEFTVVCRLASIQRTGIFSTKKGAKQIAAQLMLKVVQNLPNETQEKQIATLNAEPPEKLFRTYRELKNSDIKPKAIRLSKRHEYFLRLPEEQQTAVKKILNQTNVMFAGQSARDMVHLICKELKVEYDVKDVPGHPQNFKVFAMKGPYDCVHVGNDANLWDDIIEYFKVMFNVTIFY